MKKNEQLKEHIDFSKIEKYFTWKTDINDCFIFVCLKVKEELGYSPEEMLHKSFSSFSIDDKRDFLSNTLRSFIKNETPYWIIDNIFLKKDGNQVLFKINAVALYNKKYDFIGYEGICYQEKE